MAESPPSKSPKSSGAPSRGQLLARVGVATTTPIAFVMREQVYLERMNLLALDGCGVLCREDVPVGTLLSVAFRLSTATTACRCTAEVLGASPVTPAMLALKRDHREPAVAPVPIGGVSDSATAIFRLSDLAPPAVSQPPATTGAAKEPANAPEGHREGPMGFCLQFLQPPAEVVAALRHHLRTSRQLAERLAALGGSVAAERLAIAQTFTEGDLSKRALDW